MPAHVLNSFKDEGEAFTKWMSEQTNFCLSAWNYTNAQHQLESIFTV